jgi:Protein of unknown function (DUF3221)
MRGGKMKNMGILIGLLFVSLLGMIYGIFYATAELQGDMRGSMVGIYPPDPQNDVTIGSIVIEGVMKGKDQPENVSVKITRETRIVRLQANDRIPVPFENFKIGQEVEAKFKGPVTQSYPPQAIANEIVILN